MSINLTLFVANVFYILLYDILYIIPTFKRDFQDFTIKYKSIILINNIKIDLSQINLDISEYNLDSDDKLSITPNSTLNLLFDTLLLSTYICVTFINIAIKTKPTSKAAVKEQNKIIF